MRVYPDCIPCLLKFTLDTARRATSNPNLVQQICLDGLRIVLEHGFATMPPQVAQVINRMIKQRTGVRDPYCQDKRDHNRMAMRLYPSLKDEIRATSDPVRAAFRAATAANRIDSIFLDEAVDMRGAIKRSLTADFAIDSYGELKEALKTASTLIFLGDNAGEIVFDKLLIGEIRRLHPQVKVVYVVKDGPIINDATMQDAHEVGMEEVATVIVNGDDAPGTILAQCSAEMKQLFHGADVVMAKGQGNFETLEHEKRNGLFFLLQLKCPVVPQHIGVRIGDIALYRKPT